MIEIDGSYLEEEQTLRTAFSLSAATKKPCRIFNIRQDREKLGLTPQHLLEIQALTELCHGELEGGYLDSEEIKFSPGQEYRDRVPVKSEMAESITLALQALLPPALFAPEPVKIIFEGGATDAFFSPTIDYFQYVFLKILEKIGVDMKINIIKRGYYPEGGAKAEVIIYPSKLKSLNLTERGKLKQILAISGASELLKKKKVAERQLSGMREILGKLKLPIEEKAEYYQTQSPGSQICLAAEFENTVMGTDNLGRLGGRAEEVGKEAALELLKEEKSQACLDRRLADQILPYLALAPGKSHIALSEITRHSQTNIWVIEKFIGGKFEINPHTKIGVGVKNNLISWLPF